MRLFHETVYKLYTPKNELKIFVASDLHFSYQVKSKKLRSLINFAKSHEPDYVFIPGDLIDSNDMLKRGGEQLRLLNFLEKLGKIAPVIISFGNHDFYEVPVNRKKISSRWDIVKNESFHDELRAVPNVHLLDNEIYEDENIFVLGLTLTPEYYNFSTDKNRTNFFNPTHEKVSELLKILDNVDQKYITNLPKNKLKFALIHSPVCLSDYRVKAELAEFDYTISGHMHNGVVPPVLDELWPGTRGIISPTRNLFLPGIRNTLKTAKDKNIVVGAVTTFHECVGLAHHLNLFFPSYVALLNFKNDKKYARKPDVSKKYYNIN